ncbi:MAG: hypothetical protein AAGB14_08385, partial [Verrucomicrobiota bacterium]
LDSEEIVATEDMTADDMQEWLGKDPELERPDDAQVRTANGRVIDAEEVPKLPAPEDEEFDDETGEDAPDEEGGEDE